MLTWHAHTHARIALARRSVGKALQAMLPKPLYTSLFTYVGHYTAVQWLGHRNILTLGVKVAERFKYNVQSGLFAGMKYTRRAVVTRHATPNLLGVYERQLTVFIEAAIARCDVVVDIGSAEGYYAVGLAYLTGKKVRAFDSNPRERRICREMAKLNGVAELVSVCGWCSSDTLLKAVGNARAFIISDIEGGELHLFTPAVIRNLARADLLIEMHGATAEENELFAQKFRDTHEVQTIGHPKEVAGSDMITFLGRDALRMATEYRTFQQWIYCSARGQSAISSAPNHGNTFA
jgi:hypothetical protein